MRRTVVLLAVLASALVACGDDDDDSSGSANTAASTVADATVSPNSTSASSESSVGTDTTTVSTESPPSSRPPTSSIDVDADQAAAEAALLVLADFPSGWSEIPESDTEAQQNVQAQIAECAGAEEPRAVDFGGASVETGTFTSPSDESVEHTVGVAGSASEAEERMAGLAAPDFATCVHGVYENYFEDQPLPEDATVGELTVARLNVSPVGDETIAYRVTVPVDLGSSTVEVYADVVAVRSGRAVAGLAFGSELAPFPTEDVERYVALAAERLAQAF
jgi:hypothetical protein